MESESVLGSWPANGVQEKKKPGQGSTDTPPDT